MPQEKIESDKSFNIAALDRSIFSCSKNGKQQVSMAAADAKHQPVALEQSQSSCHSQPA